MLRTIAKKLGVRQHKGKAITTLAYDAAPLGYVNEVSQSLVRLHPEYRDEIDTNPVVRELIEDYYPQFETGSFTVLHIAYRVGDRLGFTY